MLSTKIVKLVEEFDGWKHDRDKFGPHECGAKMSVIWDEYLCNGYSVEGDLNDQEVSLLYDVLKKTRDPEVFETVKDFILWFTRNFDWDIDCKETLMYLDAYDYFIKGEEIDPSHVAWKRWCTSSKGKLTFYQDYYGRRHVKDMFPLYVESLRELLVKDTERPVGWRLLSADYMDSLHHWIAAWWRRSAAASRSSVTRRFARQGSQRTPTVS